MGALARRRIPPPVAPVNGTPDHRGDVTCTLDVRLDSRRAVCHDAHVPRDLLPIGSFATRCRLSVKALRHYDELGLLRPAHVDVTTQYRYYHRRQAPTAIAIALLRSLDVPLAAIRELLLSDDVDAMTGILH